MATQKEVLKQLEQDMFPRYEKWAADQETAPKIETRMTEASLIDQSRLGDRTKMQEALVALLEIPHELCVSACVCVWGQERGQAWLHFQAV